MNSIFVQVGIVLSSSIFIFISCNTLQVSKFEDRQSLNVETPSLEFIPAPVEGEDIVNEDGVIVLNHKKEKEFFQKKSEDKKEYFRVYVSSKDYQVRQIRGSTKLRRRPDKAGDILIQEEVGSFDIVNLNDEGTINVSLNSTTGGFEVINFDARVPRINEIAKIIQNDVMRWQLEHEFKDEKTQVSGFRVNYFIELKQLLSREEVKNRFLKKKK